MTSDKTSGGEGRGLGIGFFWRAKESRELRCFRGDVGRCG